VVSVWWLVWGSEKDNKNPVNAVGSASLRSGRTEEFAPRLGLHPKRGRLRRNLSNKSKDTPEGFDVNSRG
jgi:hypothetical protein